MINEKEQLKKLSALIESKIITEDQSLTNLTDSLSNDFNEYRNSKLYPTIEKILNNLLGVENSNWSYVKGKSSLEYSVRSTYFTAQDVEEALQFFGTSYPDLLKVGDYGYYQIENSFMKVMLNIYFNIEDEVITCKVYMDIK